MLRYSEFCEAFLPVDNFHASLLAKKAPQIGVTQTQVMFCPSTMEQYRDVWAVHLRNEMLIEKLRADNGTQIIMQQAFEILDCNRDKYIDRDDVSHNLSLQVVLASRFLLKSQTVCLRQRHLCTN